MSTQSSKLSLWDRLMMAVTFAEADEPLTAREMLNPEKVEKRPQARTRKETGKRPELRA
jgi:hypothetical protein